MNASVFCEEHSGNVYTEKNVNEYRDDNEDGVYILHECKNMKTIVKECLGKKNTIKTIVNINSTYMVPKNCDLLHVYASTESRYICLTKKMIPESVLYLKLTLITNYIEKGAIPKSVKTLELHCDGCGCGNNGNGDSELNDLLGFNIPNTVKHLRICGKFQLVPGDIPFGVIHVEFLDELNYNYPENVFPESVKYITMRTNGAPMPRAKKALFPRYLEMLDFKEWYVYEQFENEDDIPTTCTYIHYPHYFHGNIPKCAKYVFFETCTESIEKMNLPNDIRILDIGVQ
jgi:hypothetical protein